MVVDLIGSGRNMSYTHLGWRKVVHLGLRYGWKPLGARPAGGHPADGGPQGGQAGRTKEARAEAGFDESTWVFRLDPAHGIPPQHPLAYCPDVLLYCQDPVVGSYFHHGRLSAADARALAAALEKALPHMPEGPAAFMDHEPGALFNPMEWLDQSNVEHLRDLIAFCKRGGFKLVP